MNDRPFNRRRVLVVEDESLVAMLIEEMLTDLGHEVVAAVGKTDAAARVVEDGAVDLAILDVNLEAENSFGLAGLLRASDIPFVFATGYGSDGLAPEWRGVPTLQKPFLSGDLKRAIHAALDPEQR